MIVDKRYCMSSFLMLRTIADHNHTFKEGIDPELFEIDYDRIPIKSSEELEEALRVQTEEATKDGKAALALSGGIDSAILAKFVPKGTVGLQLRTKQAQQRNMPRNVDWSIESLKFTGKITKNMFLF